MSSKQLKALVNTVIKQSPVDSSQLTNPEEKFSLEKEHIIEINGYSDAPNNHWVLQLKAPINGVTEWFAYKPHTTILGVGASIVLRGKMSTFGGPDDSGVNAIEGLALVEPSQLQQVKDYFLPTQPPGTTGLARRLNPKTFYLACRWDYEKTSKSFLLESLVTVTNPQNGKTAQAKPVDWGPNKNTGRIADLSPGLAEFLGLQTDQEVEVVIPLPSH
jgi:hypothetical protein